MSSEEQLEELAAEIEALREENEQLQSRIDELEAENTALQQRVDKLEAQPTVTIADENDPIGSLHIGGAPVGPAITSKPGQTDFESAIDELQTQLEGSADGEGVDNTPGVDINTPLEQIVEMPQAVVEAQLTANQRRARFVAADIKSYGQKTPAGWTLTPKDLRTVLNAAFDTSHSQTCSRVRRILTDLGGDAIVIKDTHGEKKLVFDDDLVGRLTRLQTADHDVVSTTEV